MLSKIFKAIETIDTIKLMLNSSEVNDLEQLENLDDSLKALRNSIEESKDNSSCEV